MSIPQVDTQRLTIREYTPGDLEARHQLIQQAFGSSQSQEETRRWLEWTVAGYQELAKLRQPPYGDYAIVLQQTGSVIGSVGIVPALVPWDVFAGKSVNAPGEFPVSPEFGLFWAILPEQQRHGYATEAAQAMVEFLFRKLNVRRVVATTERDNQRSQRVMDRLGMTVRSNPGSEPFWFQVVGSLERADFLARGQIPMKYA